MLSPNTVCDGASPLRASPPQELRSRWTPSFLTLRFFPFPAANSILKLYCTSARESTVVAEPICGWLYIGVNAYVKTKCLHRKRTALHSIKCFRYTISLPLISPTNTVTTRETECAACHESIAAGSPSRQAVKGGHGGLPPCGEARRGKAPSETIIKAKTHVMFKDLFVKQ